MLLSRGLCLSYHANVITRVCSTTNDEQRITWRLWTNEQPQSHNTCLFSNTQRRIFVFRILQLAMPNKMKKDKVSTLLELILTILEHYLINRHC